MRVPATDAENPAADGLSPVQRAAVFQQTYFEWFEWQKRMVEERGLWCEGLVSWGDEPA